MPPTIIVVDINMPILGGFGFVEAFEALRAQRPQLTSTVIMMISSSTYENDIEQAKAYPSVGGYIIKADGSNGETAARILEIYSRIGQGSTP